MTKTKQAGQDGAVLTVKQSLHEVKNGSVKKNKKPKFKNTPTGRVILVDNTKAQKQSASPQESSQKFPKDTGVKNSQNMPKGNTKQLKKKQSPIKVDKVAKLQQKKELEEIDDSDSDIGVIYSKGIISQEDVGSEMSDDEEESDTDVPDIFEKSLADESDEDDKDFVDEGEDDDDDNDEEEIDDDDEISDKEETIEHKGVKMFKGVKSKTKNEILEADEDEDDDDDDDDDEEEDDEDIDLNKMDTSNLGVDGEDDDEEEEDDDEEDEEVTDISCINALFSANVDNEDDEDDEDEDENTQNSALGIKALLGKTIKDDEDDEDFNEEDEDDEDDDISDEDEDSEEESNIEKVMKGKETKASKSKDASAKNEQTERQKLSPEEREEINKRTIFIDNIPKETKPETVKKVFSQYGPINNVRFRSIIPQNPKISKKVAAITGQIHPRATTVVAYVNYKSQESAKKALNMNGKVFQGNYINVHIVAKSEQKKMDIKKAVFLGNLKFGMDPNIIWKHFGECGEIESVKLMRHTRTGQTKGIGYVNFKSEDAVALALKLDGTLILNRQVRVKPCLNMENVKGKWEKGRKRQVSSGSDNGNTSKKFKTNSQKIIARSPQSEKKFKKQQKPQKGNENSGAKNSTSFQGQKADLKNKKKNKFDKNKKAMVEKLTAKPKKPVKV